MGLEFWTLSLRELFLMEEKFVRRCTGTSTVFLEEAKKTQ